MTVTRNATLKFLTLILFLSCVAPLATAQPTIQGAPGLAKPSGEVAPDSPLMRQHDAMAQAVVKKDAVRVRELVHGGLNPNFNFNDLYRGRSGESPLGMAIYRGHLEVARALLELGADPNRPDDDGRPPIHQARTQEAVRLLLEFRADPGLRNKRGETALDVATQRGDLAAVDTLKNIGVRSTARGPDLWKLIEDGDTGTAKALLAKGEDPDAKNARGETLLERALFRKRWDIARALVEAGAALKPADTVTLQASFDAGTLAYLKAKGLDVNGAGGRNPIAALMIERPMRVASVDGKASIPAPDNVARVRNLIAQGADPNFRDRDMTLLMLAVALQGKPPEFAAMLLDAGGRVEFEGVIPADGSQVMLAGGSAVPALAQVAPNALGELSGMSVGPLGWAVLFGRADIAQRQLERDKALSRADRNIVYFAALTGAWKLIPPALRLGAEVNVRDRADVTPLMHAAYVGNTDAVRMMLVAGAAVNARSVYVWPPLTEGGWANFIGGHPPSRPPLSGGLTALGAAKKRSHAEVVKVLTEAGGRE